MRVPNGHRSGEIARNAGVSVDTLRHYERRGLLPKPRRLDNGYRIYPPEALERVLLIQRALSVGFTLDELEKLLRARDRGHPPCLEVRSIAARRLREVEQQLATRTRAARLHEAEVTGRDFGVTREIELTESPPLPPRPQQITDVRGRGGDAHELTLTLHRATDAYV